MDSEIMKLTKVSRYSYGVVIPRNYVKKLRWREKQKIKVRLKKSSIIISGFMKK
jgi:antitoxin component of MazEF toxin-antitoxin module